MGLKLRHDTAANWTSANPTLELAEKGYETDTGKWKTGTGSTAWTSLAYDPATGAYVPGGTDVAVADGGTGSSTASAARTALGLLIGTDVLAPSGSGASLTSIYKPGGTDVAIADGGTGVSTLPTGILKGAGTGAITAAVAGTDFASPLFIAQLTATQTHGNSGTGETTQWTPANFPAGSLVANATLFRVRIIGNFDNQATSGILTGRLKINGTLIATVPIIQTSITGAQTVQPWCVNVDVYVDATGALGSVTCGGDTTVETTAGAGINPRPTCGIGLGINLTAGVQVTWTLQWGTSSATNLCRTARAVIQQIA